MRSETKGHTLKIRIFPIEFHREGGMVLPKHPALFDAAQRFCSDYLAEKPNLAEPSKVWLATEVTDSGELGSPLAISAYRTVIDIPLFRSIDRGATVKIADRMNSYFADQGLRGHECLLYISDSESLEQRCPDYESSLAAFGAKPSQRYTIIIT